MGSLIRWAKFFPPAFAAMAALSPLPAYSQGAPDINLGNSPRTYVPDSSKTNPAVKQAAQQNSPTNVGQIPTPDTVPPPSILAPSVATPSQPSPGQYRTNQGLVKIEKMFLDRFQTSVVRVTSRDLSGNILAQSMGVGVGDNSQFIATPLSLILGNSQQWADTIEITHVAGNKYSAKIALIDEEKNLVLLAPEANPAPIPPVRPLDERPNVDVFMISFTTGSEGQIVPKLTRGMVSAVKTSNGILSVSAPLEELQPGTAIINSQGELFGMLLPDGKGVLTSTIQRLVTKALKNDPMEPVFTGVILGRGVLVGPKLKDAYPTISAALEAIKKGEAPKANTQLYTPAKDRTVAPKESDKVVVRVMPGTYKEEKTIVLPSNISLSGSGAGRSVIVGKDPEKPVLLLQGAENSLVSGFRFSPAPLQQLKAPTVIVSKSSDIEFLGNVLEAKGGVAFWAHESDGISFFGNTFARGQQRGLSCDRSRIVAEGNAFVGDWPIALSADKNCQGEVRRNLFFGNKTAVSVSGLVGRLNFTRNSFIRSDAALKVNGSPKNMKINDNLFFECPFGLVSGGSLNLANIGRNAVWKSKMQAGGRPLNSLDIVRTEPKFLAPEDYDFRLKPGQNQLKTALTAPGADLGAFELEEGVGEYTQQLARTLGAAVGEKDLAEAWGLE